MGAGVERFPDDVGGITDDGVGAFVMRERTDGKAAKKRKVQQLKGHQGGGNDNTKRRTAVNGPLALGEGAVLGAEDLCLLVAIGSGHTIATVRGLLLIVSGAA